MGRRRAQVVQPKADSGKSPAAYREVVNEAAGVFAQLPIEDTLASPLQQQQLIKGLKDVNAGLVNGTHDCPARVDNVAHRPHHNSRSSSIQTCIKY